MRAKLHLGLPRMHKEAGERRDFLLQFVADMTKFGAGVVLEHGYGSGMGLTEADYLRLAPQVKFVSVAEAYQQHYVLVLRYPNDDEIRLMRPGACLISMLHYPTRPQRVTLLRELGLEAISLDSLKDDIGRRLVENLRSVAWNGVEIAFQTLRKTYPAPGFDNPKRPPIHVTLLGAGAVASHVIQAAARYGNDDVRKQMLAANAPGVQTTVVDYDLTGRAEVMRDILSRTDLLVDATQRPDPTKAVIPNDWIAHLPAHAVILDLSVDPYDCSIDPPYLKGVEGVPQGNLDQYIFAPNDPAYEKLPNCVNTQHRRYAVSCYSWPGIYPQQCMQIYGDQLRPILRVLVEKKGIEHVSPKGRFFERVIARAQLSRQPVKLK
jgi:alanine dehydrogenase